MTRPRVLFATHSPAISGAEYVLLSLTRNWPGTDAFLFEDGPLNQSLTDQGLRVHISRWARGFSTFKRDKSLLLAFPLMFRLFMTVLELAANGRKVDCIYANSQKAFTLAALARPLNRRRLIWHLHDILDPSHFGRTQLKFQITLANRFADMVIVPSAAAAEAFVAQGGRETLVRVIANGTDPAPPSRYSKSDLLQELGISDVPVIGIFSRLASWKGQHVVIQALKDLPGVHIAIVGSALFGEDAYRQELQDLTAQLGLSQRVHFLGQRNEVRRIMSAVDVVVHPSTSPEPFGLTLIEAMSVGTPIVATSIGASREILQDGKAGILVPSNAPEAIASAVSEILEKKADVAEMVRNAQSLFQDRYTSEKMRDEVERAILEVDGHGKL